MGFFSTLKGIFNDTAVSVIILDLLENERNNGQFTLKPASTANQLVELAKPSVIALRNSNRGISPHKLSIAAFALSIGLVEYNNTPNGIAIENALRNLLSRIDKIQAQLSLSDTDIFLLDKAAFALEDD